MYSLSYPERKFCNSKSLNFSEVKSLEFFPVDTNKFPSVKLAYDVLARGKSAGAILNAANEVAVDFFLAGKIKFKDIFRIVSHIVDTEDARPFSTVDDVVDIVKKTKMKTIEFVDKEVNK